MDLNCFNPVFHYKAVVSTVTIMYVTQSSTVESHSSNFHSLLAPPEPPRPHEVSEVIQSSIRHLCFSKHFDCGEQGFCSVDQNGRLGCICANQDDKHVYGGVTCERRGEVLPIPSEYIIGLSVAVIIGLLVALVCLAADSYLGCRKKISRQEDSRGSEELDDSMVPSASSSPVNSSSPELTQDHISLHMQEGETDDILHTPQETTSSDVSGTSEGGSCSPVLRERMALPRIPPRQAAAGSDRLSLSSLMSEETLTQLSDCYYNGTRSRERSQPDRKFDSYRPLDTTYRVLIMGSLGPEPVFLYEPWRNIDNLQFPEADDQTDILLRSTILRDQLGEPRVHRASSVSETDGFFENVASHRCLSSCSSSSVSSDTLVCGVSETSLYWNFRDHDADSSDSDETIIVNGDLDVTCDDPCSSAKAGESGVAHIVQDSKVP